MRSGHFIRSHCEVGDGSKENAGITSENCIRCSLEREIVIEIRKSATADSRTCDVSQVSKETLLASSRQHIGDVVKAMAFFSGLSESGGESWLVK